MKTIKILPLILATMFGLSLLSGCTSNANSNSAANIPSPTKAQANTSTEQAVVSEESAALSYEEGTSESDNIVNTTRAEKVILVVSFGTSFNESRSLTIGGIEAAIKAAYPDYQVRRAFTSQIIIDKLAARDNLQIDSVQQAMARLVLDNVKEVIIQPTTVINGYEYDDIIAEAMAFADKFESLKIGKWLLADDSDYHQLADILVDETQTLTGDNTAIVWMGHGTSHHADAAYEKFQGILFDKGHNNYFIGEVEGALGLQYVQEKLAEINAEKVVLRPLMIVAGDHANNDMASDDEDSWKSLLSKDGYNVEPVLEGLGQITAVQELFVNHVEEAINSNNLSQEVAVKKPDGILGNRLKDGTYSIDVDSSTAMFKFVDCQITVEEGKILAVGTLSGQGFGKLYFGKGEEAEKETEDKFYNYTLNGERHSFTFPVEALDKELELSGWSIRKEQWYDHIVVFKSASIDNDAFSPCEIKVELTGGTGKSGIQSPTTILYEDGTNYGEIIWSSPNYTYMIVNGEKYLPTNTEGNSIFKIPIVLDEDMVVTACTVAMSSPKEIEYTLNFDSSSIK